MPLRSLLDITPDQLHIFPGAFAEERLPAYDSLPLTRLQGERKRWLQVLSRRSLAPVALMFCVDKSRVSEFLEQTKRNIGSSKSSWIHQ